MDVADALRETTRRLLADHAPPAEVRRLMANADGFDRRLWFRLAAVGLPGLLVPEQYGGAGLGFGELAVVLEEVGRALLPAPLLATTLATAALIEAGETAQLPGIAAGTTLATVAITGGHRNPDRLDVQARDNDRLYGVATHVLDGQVADLIVVAAHGPALFLVDTKAPGLARTPLPTLDQTRRLSRVTFANTPAQPIGASLDHLRDLAAVALAAEQVGGAARCLEMAVEYAKVRTQFGRPIGTFQAIQHRCADVLVAVESARSAAHHAAQLAAGHSSELPAYAALAATTCAAAYTFAAGENIQIHGGIGFTWEHDAHLYLKRAKSSEALFGSPARYRTRLAELVVGPLPS